MAFKYKGLISYSHANVKWGEWLHRALEGYFVPSSFVGMRNNRGERSQRAWADSSAIATS